MSDIDPEGYYTCPDPLCECGPLYTYAGHIEPGGYAEDCPIHGNPKLFYDEVERMRAEIKELIEDKTQHFHVTRKIPGATVTECNDPLVRTSRLRALLNPTEGETDER